jgi:hypothetical protein
MRRRDFIILPRPTATAWPRAAFARPSPIRCEPTVDHEAAEALGRDVPPTLLAHADEVIE